MATLTNYPTTRLNFHENSEYSNARLIINGTIYYVSKSILGHQSYFFRREFYVNLVEKCDETIEGVNDEGCVEFLHLMYQRSGEIKENNVYTILVLAARYDVQRITHLCEMFLISSNQVEHSDKLKYAQKFGMVGLRIATIRSIDTLDQLKKCLKEFNSMDATTSYAISNKAIEIVEKSVPASPAPPVPPRAN